MLDFNDYFYFVTVVRHNGFSAAERATDIPKTKLSRRVLDLERKLGLRLINRNARGISLTEAGQAFLAHSKAVVEQAEKAEEFMHQFRQQPQGAIRISCTNGMANNHLSPLLPGFLEAHRHISLTVLPSVKPVNLINDSIDLIVVARPNPIMGHGVVSRTIIEPRMILAASPDYLAEAGSLEEPEDLQRLKTVSAVGDKLRGPVVWELFGPEGRQYSFTHQPVLRSNDSTLQKNGAVNGLGLALLPDYVVSREAANGALRRVLPQWDAGPSPIKLAFLARKGLLPSIRALVDYLVENMPRTFHKVTV